jgi:hypothetical protein
MERARTDGSVNSGGRIICSSFQISHPCCQVLVPCMFTVSGPSSYCHLGRDSHCVVGYFTSCYIIENGILYIRQNDLDDIAHTIMTDLST